MLFSYKFFTFSRLFSQHPNKFYYRKFQNHSQIPIHRTNYSQIPIPHPTETPIQPTTANSGNQKPQPPKHHYHTTTTTTKIKITERDWWVEDRWVEGEIARRRDRRRDRAAQCDRRCAAVGAVRGAINAMRLARSGACDRRTGARGSPVMSKADLGFLSSLSLFARLT